jgi:hypothetical protein
MQPVILLGTNYFGRQSQLSDKIGKQALGWLILFFTTVNHCYWLSLLDLSLQNIKYRKRTTEWEISRRKNLKDFHKAIWPMGNPSKARQTILNFWTVEGATFLTREKSIIWNCHQCWLDVNCLHYFFEMMTNVSSDQINL